MFESEKILSVLLPSYLGHSSITRAIESVLLPLPLEVVIAPDDGSSDYERYETQYPGVVKVLKPHTRTGPAAARNRAFAAATGKFITMLDADDAFAPGAVEEALELAQSSPARISFFRTAYVDENSGSIVRELTPRQSLTFQDFSEFQGSVHALYDRCHWIPYRNVASEDVLHDAHMLLVAGGQAPMTKSPYLLHLNQQSLCANTPQEIFNRTYRSLRDEAQDARIKSLYQAKLDIGAAFEKYIQAGHGGSFHSFLLNQSVLQSMV